MAPKLTHPTLEVTPITRTLKKYDAWKRFFFLEFLLAVIEDWSFLLWIVQLDREAEWIEMYRNGKW